MSETEDRRSWRVVHHGEDRRDPDGGRVVVVERPANGNGHAKHPLIQAVAGVAAALGTLGALFWLVMSQGQELVELRGQVKDMRGLCLYGLTQLENRVQTGADMTEIRRSLEVVRKQFRGGDER